MTNNSGALLIKPSLAPHNMRPSAYKVSQWNTCAPYGSSKYEARQGGHRRKQNVCEEVNHFIKVYVRGR